MRNELVGPEDVMISRNVPFGILNNNSIRPESELISVDALTYPARASLYLRGRPYLQCRFDAIVFNACAELKIRQMQHRSAMDLHVRRTATVEYPIT